MEIVSLARGSVKFKQQYNLSKSGFIMFYNKLSKGGKPTVELKTSVYPQPTLLCKITEETLITVKIDSIHGLIPFSLKKNNSKLIEASPVNTCRHENLQLRI